MKQLRPIIKLNNEKYALRDWILSQFPENYEAMTYVEPYGGSADILFCKNRSTTEIINDRDVEIVNILRAVRDESSELVKRLSTFKTVADVFEKVNKKKNFDDYLDHATHDLYLRKISRNGNKSQFSKPSSSTIWKNNIKSINDYSTRLQDVYLFCKPALEVIYAFNCEDTFLYCDPSYLIDNKVSKTVYTSDMPPEDHIELSRFLNDFSGKVVLSGVMSPLYARLYKNWNMAKKRIATGKDKRTEIIWKNF